MVKAVCDFGCKTTVASTFWLIASSARPRRHQHPTGYFDNQQNWHNTISIVYIFNSTHQREHRPINKLIAVMLAWNIETLNQPK